MNDLYDLDEDDDEEQQQQPRRPAFGMSTTTTTEFDVNDMYRKTQMHVSNSDNVLVMQLISAALSSPNCKMQTLLLGGGLDIAGARALGRALATNNTTSLRVLIIMGTLGVSAADAEVNNNNRSESSGRCMSLLREGLEDAAAAAATTTKTSPLRSLLFFISHVDAQEATRMAALLENGDSLKHLCIVRIHGRRRMMVDEGSATRIASFVKSLLLSESSALVLRDCGIDDDAVLSLLPLLLSTCHNNNNNKIGCLRLLMLSENPICSSGALVMAFCLANNARIQVLDLSNCVIGNRGAALLGSAIKSNHYLQRLRLDYNIGITRQGLQALVDGVSVNRSMTRLCVTFTIASFLDRLNGYVARLLNPFRPQQSLTSLMDSYLDANRTLQEYKPDKSHEPQLWPQILERVSSHPDIMNQIVREHFLQFIPETTTAAAAAEKERRRNGSCVAFAQRQGKVGGRRLWLLCGTAVGMGLVSWVVLAARRQKRLVAR